MRIDCASYNQLKYQEYFEQKVGELLYNDITEDNFSYERAVNFFKDIITNDFENYSKKEVSDALDYISGFVFTTYLEQGIFDNSQDELDMLLLGEFSTNIVELLDQEEVVLTEPLGQKIEEGVYVNQEGLTKEEQLELFYMLEPSLKKQLAKTNKGPKANKMMGLGLRWDYKSNNRTNPIDVGQNIRGMNTSYGYFTTDIKGNPLTPIPQRLRELLTKATGVDISDYDGAIINLYDENTFIGPHADEDESITAIKYPVVAVNIGGNGVFVVGDNTNYQTLDLKDGAGYVFGYNGKNRTVRHSTTARSVKGGFLPTITTEIDGQTYPQGSYRITITMRRVRPLTSDMPVAPVLSKTPTKVQPQQEEVTIPSKSSNNIRFEVETSGANMREMYLNRTAKNASADATLDFGLNQEGEGWTKSAVLKNNKKYIGINTNNLVITNELITRIVQQLNSVNAKSLNIAGMGIYNMKTVTQEQVDNYVYQLLKAVINSPNLKTKIESVRTGGQTGFDEAGTKAGILLGLPTLTLAPKGWTFRDATGKDISDERLFKNRFDNIKIEEVTTQTQSTISPKGTINVYWGQPESPTSTKILSNLAPRRFTYNGVEYRTVEQAYQVLKSGSVDAGIKQYYDNLFTGKSDEDISKMSASQLKYNIGKPANRNTNLQLMEDLVLESFKQNPNSEDAKKLLQYENFTHNTNEVIDQAFLRGLKKAQNYLLSNQTQSTTLTEVPQTVVNINKYTIQSTLEIKNGVIEVVEPIINTSSVNSENIESLYKKYLNKTGNFDTDVNTLFSHIKNIVGNDLQLFKLLIATINDMDKTSFDYANKRYVVGNTVNNISSWGSGASITQDKNEILAQIFKGETLNQAQQLMTDEQWYDLAQLALENTENRLETLNLLKELC
jgi:hypothetical protein